MWSSPSPSPSHPTLTQEGSDDTKDEAAGAIWSLATDNAHNKDTIAKLGGIDPLIGLLVSGTSDTSQLNVAGAFTALAAKHLDNREYIAKRLVGLLGSSAVKSADRATRVLKTCSVFTSHAAINQLTLAKAGAIPPLIAWLATSATIAQAHAAHAVLSLVTQNAQTQTLLARSSAIPPLISLIQKSSAHAQEYAALSLWHLASQADNRQVIVESGAIRPLVAMLSADGEMAAEIAAMTMVRPTQRDLIS